MKIVKQVTGNVFEIDYFLFKLFKGSKMKGFRNIGREL
jgi:hypothetical protein